MAWTTPRTWVVGEVVTASIMNAHVRDNENAIDSAGWLGGATGLAGGSSTSTTVALVGTSSVTVTVPSGLSSRRRIMVTASFSVSYGGTNTHVLAAILQDGVGITTTRRYGVGVTSNPEGNAIVGSVTMPASGSHTYGVAIGASVAGQTCSIAAIDIDVWAV